VNVIVEHLQYEFFQRVIVACLLVGTVCGLLSTYVVLRRLVFAAVALTQLSSAGLGIAVLSSQLAERATILAPVAAYLLPLPTSLATTLVGVGILALVQPGRKARTDNLVALLYVGGWAVSILLFAVAERGDTEMAHILYGDILGVLMKDIYYFLPVAVVVALLALLLGKELLFTSFDPETAATYRIPVWLYDVAFFSMLALVIVFAVKMLGLMLVFAYLVAPGTTALLFCKRMPPALVFSVVFAAVMSLLGLFAAAVYDLPPGPAVTATGILLLLAAFFVQRTSQALAAPSEADPLRLRSNSARVIAVTAALVIATVLAAGLAGRIGSEDEHQPAPVGQEHHVLPAPSGGDEGGAAAVGESREPEVEYAPTLGDELPDTDDLLGEPADTAPTADEAAAAKEDAEASDASVESAPTVGDELPDVDALLGEG
jgi:ABC-type Mn2+/Zn2+ transport system permease subunit